MCILFVDQLLECTLQDPTGFGKLVTCTFTFTAISNGDYIFRLRTIVVPQYIMRDLLPEAQAYVRVFPKYLGKLDDGTLKTSVTFTSGLREGSMP